MNLTPEDLNQIEKLIAASEERVYRRIKDNALSEIIGRLDTVDETLDTMDETLAGMGEALGRVERQVAEIPVMNENIDAIRNHLGI